MALGACAPGAFSFSPSRLPPQSRSKLRCRCRAAVFTRNTPMSSAALSLVLVLTATGQVRFDSYNSDRYGNDGYGTIRKDELDYQKDEFQHWWGAELNFKLADLPAEGKVPDYRIPYAGHDYPDRAGGTYVAMT